MAMRAEHRKAPPTHAVTETVGRWFKELTSRPSTSSIVFWLVLVLIVVLYFAWTSYRKWELKHDSDEWYRLGSATTVDDLKEVEKAYPSTVPALMARFEQARVLLRQGLDKYAADNEKERTEAQDKLKQAGELYEQLAKDVDQFSYLRGQDSAGPLLKQEALWGAAKAHESQGDLDGARTYYQRLADSKPETERVKEAAAAVKTLDDQDARAKLEQFYTTLREIPGAKAPPPAPAP
jgi:tetratricopeptide (TPR) repeat protein